ncbi:MAG: DUF362 domain-containing protein, partial [Dehalococcoidia bacterium]|nr:DUF362 domain-containing protein [Dehalococcoidia bacterium]
MSRAKVVIRCLRSEHNPDTFARFRPLGEELRQEIGDVAAQVFDSLGGKALLKSSRDVYLKPNAVDSRPYSFTRPELVEAAVRYWLQAGARRIYLMDNSTQGTYTRLVFKLTGYSDVCRRTGAIPVYLDEDRTVTLEFPGKEKASRRAANGYELKEFRMPRTVVEKLMERKDENLYVSLPKLKTHSMAVVTLGIKNQWGFPRHSDRGLDHNYNLHSKLVDVLAYVRPDVTLIEGVEGTIYGHYPVTAFADRCVKPFRILIGGLNAVAVDIAGAAVFGLGVDDVPHIRLAIERGLSDGVLSSGDIELVGDYSSFENLDIIGDLSEYGGKYPFDLYPQFPPDVTIIRGKERACREGCVNNPLTLLQFLYYDYGGKGGWALIMGKGLDPGEIDAVKGPVLVAGKCAVEEVSARLIRRLGRSRVYISGEC